MRPNRLKPGVETLDARVVPSTLAPPTHPTPGQYPSANAHRAFTPADLSAYAAAYQTFVGEPNYTPQYDFNGTGFIGQNDATPILRGLASSTPKAPFHLTLALAPGEQVTGHHPANSGGTTRQTSEVTVVGKTTPNSIIFFDGQTAKPGSVVVNFQFTGGATVSDSNGRFEFTVPLASPSRGGSLTTTAVLVRTPFGQQAIRSFPIRLVP